MTELFQELMKQEATRLAKKYNISVREAYYILKRDYKIRLNWLLYGKIIKTQRN